MNNSNTVTQTEVETITTTIKVPEELWKSVKKAAIDRKTSAQQLCVDGLRKILSEDQHAA